MSLQPDAPNPAGGGMKRKREEPEAPQPPVSHRRSAVPKLDQPVHPSVLAVLQQRATTLVANFDRYDTDVPSRTAPLDRTGETNRKIAQGMHEALQRSKRRRIEQESTSDTAQTGVSQLTHKGEGENVQDEFRSFLREGGRGLEHPFGNRKGGVSDRDGEVFAVNPGFKVGEQALQLLGHLAHIFMSRVSDMEYQSMLVNDRVFVAANAQEKIREFRGEVLKAFLEEAARDIQPVNALPEKARPYRIGAAGQALALDPASTDPLTPQQTDGANMLAEYETGHHVDHGSRKGIQSILNVLQHQARNQLQMLGPFTPDAAAAYVAAPQHKYAVILVETPTKTGWHAEQALAMTLVTAGWTTGATISGTKVPCYVCWLTLNLLVQCDYDVAFTQTPGFVWESNTLPGLTHVAKKLGIQTVSHLRACFIRAQVNTGAAFRQFMSAMTTQTDLEVDIDADDLSASGRHLRNDISQRSFYVDTFTPTPTPLPNATTTYRPVGSYGTPPGSPGGQQDTTAWAEYEQKRLQYEIDLAEYRKSLADHPDGNPQ
ncbi:hypothetical protein [Actinokineospora sp. NPDC004072]